jgi:hypothetical protein
VTCKNLATIGASLRRPKQYQLAETLDTALFLGDAGDDSTARAVAAVAHRRGMKGLIWKYLETRPQNKRGENAQLSVTPAARLRR